MASLRETTKNMIDNTPSFNFRVERCNEIVGEMQGIPVENSNYLHQISSTVDIKPGDCLVNNLGQKFTVIKTEIINNGILRIYFSK